MSLLPGVHWKEIDLSHYVPRLNSTMAGVVGTATKGPINKRVLIGSMEHLVQVFGYPSKSHPGLQAAREYLREGNMLQFVRVESEATPATTAEVEVGLADGTTATWSAKDAGSFYEGMILSIVHSNPINTRDDAAGDAAETTFAVALSPNVVPRTVRVLLSDNQVATDDGEGTITGTGVTGTINYDTGVGTLTFTVAPAAGAAVSVRGSAFSTFNLEVLKVIENKTYPMESFKNLSLNNLLESHYSKQLATSNMVAVPTLAAMPLAGSYVLTGGDDGLTGIDDADYIGTVLGDVTTGLQLFANPEETDVNTVAVPGMSTDAIVQALVALGEERRDGMVIIDPPKGISADDMIDWINGTGDYSARNAINSSYAAVYYPWVRVFDSYNDEEVLSPPSGFALAAFVRSDRYGTHYAPAGASRGKVLGAVGLERTLNAGQKTALYLNRVNPIADFVSTGILLWGQKTTQVAASDLDRIIGRRTLNMVEKTVVTALQPLVFEPNNRRTWARATAQVQPFLDGLVAKDNLLFGRIVCDETTNTAEVVSRNEMVVNVFLKLPKSAEVITVNFVLLATGAEVNEYIGRQF